MSAKSTNQRKDPYGNYRFIVEIDGIPQASFSEVILPESASEIIEHREGNSSTNTILKQAGLVAFTNLILKWGLTTSMDLYNWRKLVEQGKISTARRNMSVVVLDEENMEAARWNFSNAWPSKYKAPDLNGMGNDMAVEMLEIVFESMQRVK
jgi:phage tail-like protein